MNGDIIGGETWSAVSNGGQDIGSSSTSGDHVSPAHSAKYISPHIGNISKGDAIDLISRKGAHSMDAQRKEHIAYEYLCHLEEAKKWIEACTEEELPLTTELEEALRTGVILCKLGNWYAPEVLPLKKIYDMDGSRLKLKGLHFKHTDNFNYWLKSLRHIGLPEIFYPETTDLYDKKNMPRVIYCIHALSLYLHKLGKAPEIEDLVGTVVFTEEEISAMKLELDKYGITMPSFGKIGGILANEMSVDEAAIHAAVLAINEALEQGDPEVIMAKLQNPSAVLNDVDPEHISRYQAALDAKKREKKVSSSDESDVTEADAYDYMLTQSEIQECINNVNEQIKEEIRQEKLNQCVSQINSAVGKKGMTALLNALQDESANLRDVVPQNLRWYMDVLSKTRAGNGEHGNEDLSHEEIQDIILMANQIAEHTRLVEEAVVTINSCLSSDDIEQLMESLQNENLSHFNVIPTNSHYYQEGLRERLRKKREESGNPSCLLTEDDIEEELICCNERAETDRLIALAYQGINESLIGESVPNTMTALQSEHADLNNLISHESSQRYHSYLKEAREKKGEDLTKEEIIQVLQEVNAIAEKERLLAEGVASINSALSSDDPQVLSDALSNEYVGLEEVDYSDVPHYSVLLKTALAAKIERANDPSIALSKDEFQQLIHKANAQKQEAIKMAEALHAINESLQSEDSQGTLLALKASELSLRSITDECSNEYHNSLGASRSEKMIAATTGEESEPSGWTEHRTRDGYKCYYDNSTGQYSWTYPEGWSGQSSDLSKEEIQSIITKVTADYDRWALLKSNEPLIITLQSVWRGAIERRRFNGRLNYLKAHEAQAVKLQAQWKGLVQRRAYRERRELLLNSVHVIIKLQAWARMVRQRRQYRERLEFFRKNVEAIIKIQSFWRAKKTKKHYKQLVEVTQPPASAVRKFLSLLEQSDLDFTEEIECQRLKSQVVQQIRSNQQLEQDVSVIDLKIGLLVKNRLSIQDVVSQTDQMRRNRRRKGGAIVNEGETEEEGIGLGGLSKASQEKIEAYQHLFYLLQTDPHYFAKLIFEMSPNRTNKFMENVILTVLNYAQNNREQYLLVKLFETALIEEIDSKVFALKDIITGNPTVIKMVIHFTRSESEGGHTVLRDLLSPLVKEILDKEDLVLNISPVDVYKSWINQMESETGEKSKLPYEVSNDQALSHDEVKQRISKTIQVLMDATEKFQQTILSSVARIPYTMRYIAMCLRQALHKKFPEAEEDDVLKVVGNLLYYRYMNPAVVAPDAFDIIDMGMEKRVLETDQRRNLGAIAKVLQHAAAGKTFEGENAALSSMNGYIMKAFDRFKQFFLAASTVDLPSQRFGYDEYTDVIMVTKPVIHISVKEVIRTHTLLVEHEEALAPEAEDPLREILKDLGSVPSVEVLLGGVREAAPGEDKEDVVNEASKQELALTLNNKFEAQAAGDSSDMKALFVRTKRMVVDLLRVQPGDNLTQILYTPATPEQEEEHQRMIKERELSDQEKMNKSLTAQVDSVYTDRDLPLEGMKRKIMRQLRTLEQEELVSSENDYQEIINAIAKDIRNQHRHRQQRKVELKRLQETMEKLNIKAHFYEEQLEYYQQYVKACLDSFAKTSGTSDGPAGFKKQTVKYTAQRLYEKGVVLEIDGLPKHQFRNAVIEITSLDVGVFEVRGRVLGVSLDKFELVFQDLLQMQYEGVAVMKMLGRAKINVNLLIYLINKKFYGKG